MVVSAEEVEAGDDGEVLGDRRERLQDRTCRKRQAARAALRGPPRRHGAVGREEDDEAAGDASGGGAPGSQEEVDEGRGDEADAEAAEEVALTELAHTPTGSRR